MDDIPANVTFSSWPRAAQNTVIYACALLSVPLRPSLCKKGGATLLEAPKMGGTHAVLSYMHTR